MTNIKISLKLGLGFGLMGLLLAASVLITLVLSRDAADDVEQMVGNRLATVTQTADVAIALNGTLSSLRGFLLTGNDAFKAERKSYWTALDQAAAKADTAFAATGGAEAETWRKVRGELGGFHAIQDKVEAAAAAGDAAGAAAMLRTEALPVANKLLDLLNGARRLENDTSGGLRTMLQTTFMADAKHTLANLDRLVLLQEILLAIAILAAIAVGYAATRSIVPPLRRLTEALAAVAEGRPTTIADTARGDEIGAMARAAVTLQQVTVSAARLQSALGNVSGNIMVADTENRIIFCNKTMIETMRRAESDIRRDLPDFRADKMVGSTIDVFHKNPAYQQGLLAKMTGTHRARIRVGGRQFDLVANPSLNERGERVGTSVEWTDVTAQVAMEEEIAATVSAAGSGDFSRRLTVNAEKGFVQQLSDGINTVLGIVESCIAAVGGSISAVAKGDLTRAVTADFQGQLGALKSDVNTTIKSLHEIAGQLHGTAAALRSASDEIAAGSQDLAQRTESQAASIEQTAASMQQITATVKQNADNAQAANQLAVAARNTAEAGQRIVKDAVAAVAEIEESARKIADIMTLIDEIAFQTNLLALNASVEAARAGEAGKGFAVVAQEVRALAQRSASASKEIKGLITNSSAQVKTGANLVGQTGTSLQEIVTAIKKASDIVAEIAAASGEQAVGLEQVNTAVSTMDEMTQRNAALVEQTSASARALTDQAEALHKAISFFRTA